MTLTHLERLGLIDRIGRELQTRMSYDDIKAYLQGHGVNTHRETPNVNSKWVYAKSLLSDATAETAVRIADELEVPHTFVLHASKVVSEPSFWEPHHFRLFISHLSTLRERTVALQRALRRFGISAFVAHADIEPTKEWQDEIEAALLCMDALAAILMPGFKESDWTEQEVGVAVGRDVLVIPICRGLNPYGFIAKYQGLSASDKTVGQLAKEIFQILVSSPKTKIRMLTCLVDSLLRAAIENDAIEKLRLLMSLDLPIQFLHRLRDGAPTSAVFAQGPALALLNFS